MPVPRTKQLKQDAKKLKPRGRPPKTDAQEELVYDIDRMIERVEAYLNDKKIYIPILKECCLLNNWNYDYVMQLKRESDLLSQSIKKLLNKKEVVLEQMLYSGANNTGYIFSLKQLGWRDKIETFNTDDIDQPIYVNDGLPE
jgi:hypothetical protein